MGEKLEILSKAYLSSYGSPYICNQTLYISDSLGLQLLHCPPREPQGKGKIERVHRTGLENFSYTLDPKDITSLAQLNVLYKQYLNEYHQRVHSTIQMTPERRYELSVKNVSFPAPKEKYIDWVNKQFLNRIYRKVRNDNTIVIDRVYYDVPPELKLIGKKILVKFRPYEKLTSVYIDLGDDNLILIEPTDRAKNFFTRRNELPTLDYSKMT